MERDNTLMEIWGRKRYVNYYNGGREAGMERETTTMEVGRLGWREKLLQCG